MTQHAETAGGSILVVEDDPDIRELMIGQLRREAYVVHAADSIATAITGLTRAAVDLVIIDLSLPDGDGVDLCSRLRSEGNVVAIMMVTARDAPMDRVRGLELGADDYLTKPFEPRELLARVRNLFKHMRAPRNSGKRNARIARFGPWRLDLHQRRLIAPDDRLVMLSAAEYRLLSHFLDSPDKPLSREDLLPERGATVAFDRTIDLQISRLRHKLASEPHGADCILTVRNEGYVMPGPVAFE